MKVSATFTSQLVSNHITKMEQTSTEINGKFKNCLKPEIVKLLETLHTRLNVERSAFQVKVFELINILLI